MNRFFGDFEDTRTETHAHYDDHEDEDDYDDSISIGSASFTDVLGSPMSRHESQRQPSIFSGQPESDFELEVEDELEVALAVNISVNDNDIDVTEAAFTIEVDEHENGYGYGHVHPHCPEVQLCDNETCSNVSFLTSDSSLMVDKKQLFEEYGAKVFKFCSLACYKSSIDNEVNYIKTCLKQLKVRWRVDALRKTWLAPIVALSQKLESRIILQEARQSQGTTSLKMRKPIFGNLGALALLNDEELEAYEKAWQYNYRDVAHSFARGEKTLVEDYYDDQHARAQQ